MAMEKQTLRSERATSDERADSSILNEAESETSNAAIAGLGTSASQFPWVESPASRVLCHDVAVDSAPAVDAALAVDAAPGTVRRVAPGTEPCTKTAPTAPFASLSTS